MFQAAIFVRKSLRNLGVWQRIVAQRRRGAEMCISFRVPGRRPSLGEKSSQHVKVLSGATSSNKSLRLCASARAHFRIRFQSCTSRRETGNESGIAPETNSVLLWTNPTWRSRPGSCSSPGCKGAPPARAGTAHPRWLVGFIEMFHMEHKLRIYSVPS
jgi:hypothetical protein